MKGLKKAKTYLTLGTVLLFLIIGTIAGINQDLIAPYTLWVGAVILLAGMTVGFMNVTKQEYTTFMVGCIVLAVIGLSGILGIVPAEWGIVGYILKAWAGYLLVLSGSAGVATALKALWSTAKD